MIHWFSVLLLLQRDNFVSMMLEAWLSHVNGLAGRATVVVVQVYASIVGCHTATTASRRRG